MSIEEKLRSIKARYEKFLKKGGEDPFALKSEVERLLEEAKANSAFSAEKVLKEILMDLSFSIEETKCKCHTTKCEC